MNSQHTLHHLHTAIGATLDNPSAPRTPMRAIPPSRGELRHETSLSSLDNDNGYDDDEDTTSDATSPRPRFVALKILSVCVLLLMCIISVTFAVRTWLHYERQLFLFEWRKVSCKVHSKSINESPVTRGLFRVEVEVSGLLPNTTQHKLAFYGPSDEYNRSKEEAHRLVDSVDLNGSVCWVKRSNLSQISVSMVPLTDEEAELLKRGWGLAWGLTSLAAVVSLVCVGLCSHFMHGFVGDIVVVEGIGIFSGGAIGGTKSEGKGLTKVQTRYVCELMGCVVKAKDEKLKGWTCSVCLDGELEGGDRTVRTVVLGCAHRFHSGCIRRWLQVGRATCPLCHWDVKSLFDASGAPKVSMGDYSATREGEEKEKEEDLRVADV